MGWGGGWGGASGDHVTRVRLNPAPTRFSGVTSGSSCGYCAHCLTHTQNIYSRSAHGVRAIHFHMTAVSEYTRKRSPIITHRPRSFDGITSHCFLEPHPHTCALLAGGVTREFHVLSSAIHDINTVLDIVAKQTSGTEMAQWDGSGIMRGMMKT